MRRSLGLFDVVCIGLNAIVGSGIFALPDDLYRKMGWLSPFAFLLCAVGLLPIALCYAEAASKVDRTGGPYLYTSTAFGPRVGFVVGWMCFANAVFSFAAVASIAAANFGRLVPAASSPFAVKAVALAVIALFAALNYRGAKPGAVAIDVFTIAKFAVLIVLIAALVPEMQASRFAGPLPQGIAGIGSATFIALFAAQGFEVVPVPAGETRNPERALPIAVLGSMLAASLLYLLVQVTLVGAFPGLGEDSNTPLADAAIAVVPALGMVVAVGGLISTVGFVSGSALGTPRYLYAAAVDGHLPRGLAALHPRFESPHLAILTTGVLAAAFALPFDYRALIGMSNVTVAVQYLGTCLAVLRLRKLEGDARSRKRSALIPLLGAAVSLSIFYEASREEMAWSAASLAAGVSVVAVTRYLRRRALAKAA